LEMFIDRRDRFFHVLGKVEIFRGLHALD
jgi:hypothetical protein